MDSTLVKILNMASSGSLTESDIAIEQSFNYMKKRGQSLRDVDFGALYRGDLVGIRLISRFAREITDPEERGAYIRSWTREFYGTQIREKIVAADDKRTTQLKEELAKIQKELVLTQKELVVTRKEAARIQDAWRKLQEEQSRHQERLHPLQESLETARDELKKSQWNLQQQREKNRTDHERYEHMIHAKSLQINTLKDEFKMLLSKLRCQLIYGH